jgi:restriction system protein
VEILPVEFEKLVLEWLRRSAAKQQHNLETTHLGVVHGSGGDYKIDVLARITFFAGAVFIVLVECKHQARPVEREDVMVLDSKLRDVGAHKGILFSTSGFQSGALQYAKARGVATVTVVQDAWLYITRAATDQRTGPLPVADLDPYMGIIMQETATGVSCHTINSANLDSLMEWLVELPGSGQSGKHS